MTRRRKKPPATVDISAGDWFNVPLPSQGHAVGLVSRVNKKQYQAFCYFFGPRRTAPWTEEHVLDLQPEGNSLLGITSILGFKHGQWTKVASEVEFDPKRWKMPAFIGTVFPEDGFVPGMLKTIYSDDLSKTRTVKAEPSDMGLPPHALYGYKALEEALDELL